MANGSAIQDSEVEYTAVGVEIGEYVFVLAVAICHILALVGVIAISLFSGLWRSTPAFDYADIGSMSTAVRLGADRCGRLEVTSLQHWKGDSDYPKIRELLVQYETSMLGQHPIVRITDGRRGQDVVI